MLFMKTRQLVLPEHNIISLNPVCVCVHVRADVHEPVLSTEVLRGCGQQKLVPLESPLLAVNDTNRDCVLSVVLPPPPLSYSYVFFIPVFFDSPSHLFSLHIFIPFLSPFTVPHLSVLQSLLPLFSPCQMVSVSLGWLQNQSNSFFFFFLPPSLLLCLSPQSNFSVFPLRGL